MNRKYKYFLYLSLFQEFLKKYNLIDVWTVYEESRKLLSSGEPSRISLVYVQSIPESEKPVLSLLNLGTLRTISLVDKSLEISEPFNIETYDPGEHQVFFEVNFVWNFANLERLFSISIEEKLH